MRYSDLLTWLGINVVKAHWIGMVLLLSSKTSLLVIVIRPSVDTLSC